MWSNLDFETRSRADIRACGAYKYAEDPSTEVLIIGISLNNGPVLTWDIREDPATSPAVKALRTAIEEGYEIHAFNSQFEWCILKYVCTRQFGFPVPDINKMRCTAAVCRSAGLPPSLARAAEFLKLPVQKDKMGSALIQKFSVPNRIVTRNGKRIDPSTISVKKGDEAIRPEEISSGFINWNDEISFTAGGEKMTAATAFQRFVDYCAKDVRVEMDVGEAMAPFALKDAMLDTFLADARLNDRGVPVDALALSNAHKLVIEHERKLNAEFKKITGLAPSQNAKVLEWLKAEGYPYTSLNKETREKASKGLTEKGRTVLDIKAQLSFAAVKKIPSMLATKMEDNFIRGSFLWYGAQKTGRWTCKSPQWQNMKKAPKRLRKIIEEIYQDVRNGIDLTTFESFYGDPYETIACLARYFVRFENTNIYDLDFAQVEARILPALIGAQRILDKFLPGQEDFYTSTARALGEDRDFGKTLILATQFQGGWNAVFTASGGRFSRSRCEEIAAIIRKENPELPEAWRKFQNAFIESMQNPGKWVEATEHVQFGYTRKAPFPRMLMRLPSGRKIVYPHPEIKPITMVKLMDLDKKTGERLKTSKWERVNGHHQKDDLEMVLSIGDPFLNPNVEIASSFFTHELTFYGHVEGVNYGRVNTYGGDLLQSATQGTGVDLLSSGCLEAERRGYNPFLIVHDQCLALAENSLADMIDALCTVPSWFEGFPLEADGDEVRSYCKN